MLQNEQAPTNEDLEEQAFQAELNAEIDAIAPVKQEAAAVTEESLRDVQEEESSQEAERVEVIPGYTKEELNAALAEIPKLKKSLDTTNGTYGQKLAEQQKLIEELRSSKPAEQAQQLAKLSPDKFSRLRKEFPELADIFVEDLGEVLQAQPVDMSAFDQQWQSKLDEIRQEREQEQMKREVRLLKREHPDFEQVAGYQSTENGLIRWNNPFFGEWVSAQPKEVQDQVIQGNDAYELSDLISAYKKSRQAGQDTVKQKRQSNLEKAIQPRGTPTARSSAQDDEDKLFYEELSREEY